MRYRWDDFTLDTNAYRLEKGGVLVPLEPKAFNLLSLIVQRPGQLFTKQELFESVWPQTAVTDHALTRVVALLRRSLGDEAREARYIETVPTRGYRWVCPVEVTTDRIEPQPRPPERVPPIAEIASRPALRFTRRFAAPLTLTAAALAFFVWTSWSGSGAGAARAVDPASASAWETGTMKMRWPVQQTTHSGLDMQPAFSPQGDALAFVSDVTGAREIYVRDLGGAGGETPITRDGAENAQPAWSPDGRLLAYHSNRRGGIWVIAARGGIPRQVTASGSKPAWSPDGRRIVFQSDEQTDITPSAYVAQSGSTLWLVDADGSHLREVTHAGHPIGGHGTPAWNRDGTVIAFAVSDGPGRGVWILDVATGETRLIDRGIGLYEVAFAPDDSAIYAAGGEAMIARLPFDRVTRAMSGARTLIPVPGLPSVRGLSISARGDRMAFAGMSLSSQIWAQPIGPDGSAAGDARPLTTDTSRRNSTAVVSPDGMHVAYTSSRSGEPPNIWVMTSDGAGRMQLTSDESAENQPAWLPDGRRVFYRSNRDGKNALWAADIETRREERLFDLAAMRPALPTAAKPAGQLAELRFAPSMKRAAFSVVSPPMGRRVLYVSGTDAYVPRALTDGSSSVGYPAWSPDERQIAVEIKDGSSTQAGIIDIRTGQLRVVSHERGQTWVRSWSPDGRKIAVAALRDGSWSLRWIDLESGRQGDITPPAPANVYLRYPEWSPRGDVVFFERGELRGNIWTLALR